MHELDKKRRIELLGYPAVLMAVLILLVYIACEIFKNNTIGVYIFEASLYLLYPLGFITQGLLLRRYKENIWIGTAISSIAFMAIIFIVWQANALAYMIFYAVVELIAYFFYYLFEVLTGKLREN